MKYTNNPNKELKLDLTILGLTIFLTILGIVFMFGLEFYEEDVDILGLPFGCYEVTFWVLGFLITTVFGTKALGQSFKIRSTNLIFAIAGAYLTLVILSLWNSYNEIQEMIRLVE